MLPFPRRVLWAMRFASLSIWKIRPLELLNRPATVGVNVEVECTCGSGVDLCTRLSNLVDGSDNFAVDFTRISVERMFASSASAFRPWIALRSCASSNEYSAFSALDFAVTVTFSIENAISLKALPNRRQVLQRRLYAYPDQQDM